MTTTTKTPSHKAIEAAGGKCCMLPADDAIGTQETWTTYTRPAKNLNAGECRWMREEGLLTQDGFDKLTGATVYKLAVQS